MKFARNLMTVLMVLLMSSAALAEVKLGFVDLQKAIEMTTTGKKAKSDLQKEFEAKKKDLQKKEEELKKMHEDLEKKKTVISADVLSRKQTELQQEVMKFRQSVADSEGNIREKEQKLTQPILDKLEKAIAEVAKEQKVTLVLHQSDKFQTVLWAEKEVDLTDAVVKKYESMK